MKIMVIEDKDNDRNALSNMLFEVGIDTVAEFNTGYKAIQYLEFNTSGKPSCIFVSVDIEGESASRFIDDVMLHSVHHDIPIFALVDNNITMAVLEELNHDICAYINKPLSIKQIRECIHMARKIKRVNILLETHAS